MLTANAVRTWHHQVHEHTHLSSFPIFDHVSVDMSALDLLEQEVTRMLMLMAKKSKKSGVWKTVERVVAANAFTLCPALDDDEAVYTTATGANTGTSLTDTTHTH